MVFEVVLDYVLRQVKSNYGHERAQKRLDCYNFTGISFGTAQK